MEDAVSAEITHGKGLGVVFERVWRGFSSFVAYFESLPIFYKDKVRAGSGLMD